VIIIVVLKQDQRINLKEISGHESGGLIWVDTSQYIDKNNNYYNFKTLLESRPGAIPELWVRTINSGWPKIFHKNETKQPHFDQKHFKKKSTVFLPLIYTGFLLG
jgi:hypothetical protein